MKGQDRLGSIMVLKVVAVGSWPNQTKPSVSNFPVQMTTDRADSKCNGHLLKRRTTMIDMRAPPVCGLLFLCLLACDSPNAEDPADAAVNRNDSGGADPVDAGKTQDAAAQDAGPEDAGLIADGGPPDGGAPNDSGPGDAGQAGACTNPADEAIHNTVDVSAAVGTCAGDCFGASPCVRRCITNDIGLSAACTECYVDVTRCTVQNCIADCSGQDSAACSACRDAAGCTAAFDSCSGL